MYELTDKQHLFIFTGPDGSGRKTVADMVRTTFGMKKVISYSTRRRRPGEVDGQDYHFITADEFLEAERAGEFVESVSLNSNYYGIKDRDIEQSFKQAGCVSVVMNCEGAELLKSRYGDKAVRIFIHADRDTVSARQQERGLSPTDIRRNLAHYDEDMAYQEKCEHSFVNYDLAHTVYAVSGILETYLQRDLLDLD